MPRIVLAGGLDCERTAFAAELANLWNDVPPQCEPFHHPVGVITPDEITNPEDLSIGSWIVQGSYFTRQQAKIAKYASHVVSIMYHESQIEVSEEFEEMRRNRDMMYHLVTRHGGSGHMIFDRSDRVEDGWNALTLMADYLRSQRLIDHRAYVERLKNTAWQRQQ